MANVATKKRAKPITKRTINVQVENGIYKNASTGRVIDHRSLNSHSKVKEYRIVGVDNAKLATGVAINKYEKTAIKFLEDLKNYDSTADDIKSQIEISNKMFRHEDVVSTGLEILVDFTTSGFELINISDKLKPLVTHFKDNVNKSDTVFTDFGLKSLLRSLALEYFISGNDFPAEIWDDVKIDNTKYTLPTKLILLNPLNIEVDEAAFAAMEQKLLFVFGRGGTNKRNVNLYDLLDAQKVDFSNSPIFVENQVNIFKDGIRSGSFLTINNKLVSHIKRKARNYDMWGMPYLTKLAQAVTYKQKLWQLDLNTIDGLINFITIFRVGSSDRESPFHNPPPERLAAFSSLINNPQASSMLVWPHDVDIITAGPKGDVLSFADKYKEANRAIIQGLGIPQILIDGTGTATASWTAILALNRRLEIVRDILKTYVEHLIRKIAIANKLEGELTGKETIKWFPSDLRDEKTIKMLLLAFYDRGLLPKQTAHNEAGYNHEEMVELKLKEQDDELDELFVRPDIPFTNPPTNTKDPTPGRPTDNIDTNSKGKAKSKIVFAHNTDLIAEKYHEDVTRLLDSLEVDIMSLPKKSRGQVGDLVLVTFVRLSQIADTYSNFDNEADIVFSSKLTLFHEKHLDNLREYASKNLTRIVSNKLGEERDLLVSGVIAQAKKRASLFVKESLKNIDLAKILTQKSEEGYVGADISTPPDTECEYCRELHGEYLTLAEIFDRLPAHPHQRFGMKFRKDNPIVEGKKKKKTLVQDPRNKSKKL